MSLYVVIFACNYKRSLKICQSPRHKIHTDPAKNPPDPHKYPTDLDKNPMGSYNSSRTPKEQSLMSVAYRQAQLQKYRITLEVSCFEDFDPHQVDWEKLFQLEPSEKCEAYVEDLSRPDLW